MVRIRCNLLYLLLNVHMHSACRVTLWDPCRGMAADKKDASEKPNSSFHNLASRILRLMAWWKVRDSNGRDGQPKTVNIIQGYFFLVNFCIGTGFLGIPYSFFYSGYLAAVPTLILTAFCTWVTARWLLEIMARAQVHCSIIISFLLQGHAYTS